MIFQGLFYFIFLVLVGKVLLSLTSRKNENSYFDLFIEATTGFFFSISLFSIVKTSGITISSVFVLWSIAWWLVSKETKTPSFAVPTFNVRILAEVSGVILMFYAFSYWKYHFDNGQNISVHNWDALSDVTRAIFLNFTGVENSNTNFIQIPSGSQPYHYFESWAVAFFSSVFNSNFWLAQNLIFHPIILGITYLGFRSLTNRKKWDISAFLFGIFMLFASGFLTDWIKSFHFFTWTSPLRNNIIDEPWWTRMSVLYPIIIVAIHFFRKQSYQNALFAILLLPFLSVTPAIPIITTSFISVVFGIIFFKEKSISWKLLLLPVIAAVVYKVFYMIFIDPSDFIPLPTIDKIVVEMTQPSILKSKIIIIIEKVVQTGILYAPLILMLGFGVLVNKKITMPSKWTNTFKMGLTYVLVLVVVSLTMWQVLNFVFGASFFYYYTLIPFINILLVYFIWKQYESRKYKGVYLIFVIVSLSFYFYRTMDVYNNANQYYCINRYDKNFLKDVRDLWNKKFEDTNLSLGVKLESHSEIEHPFFNDGLSLCGFYIYGIVNAPALISLSRADLPDELFYTSSASQSFTKNSSFYQYVNSHNHELSINEHKKNFILDFEIKYGVVSPKGKIPPNFRSIIDTVITDVKSGERFILFKNKKNELDYSSSI